MNIKDIFDSYQQHFETYWRKKYLSDSDEDEVRKCGWWDAFRLVPATQDQIATLESKVGPLPPTYKSLLLNVGSGFVLLPKEFEDEDDFEEPTGVSIFTPDEVVKAVDSYNKWLTPEWLETNQAAGFDMKKMLPFIGDINSSNFGLLTRQTEQDDRAFIWHHDDEVRALKGGTPLTEFLSKVLESGRVGKPLLF